MVSGVSPLTEAEEDDVESFRGCASGELPAFTSAAPYGCPEMFASRSLLPLAEPAVSSPTVPLEGCCDPVVGAALVPLLIFVLNLRRTSAYERVDFMAQEEAGVVSWRLLCVEIEAMSRFSLYQCTQKIV